MVADLVLIGLGTTLTLVAAGAATVTKARLSGVAGYLTLLLFCLLVG